MKITSQEAEILMAAISQMKTKDKFSAKQAQIQDLYAKLWDFLKVRPIKPIKEKSTSD